MEMVRVARFADLTEAQVVMSALRSANIDAVLQNEHAGQANFLWQPAMGGFAILVPQDFAGEAAGFIRQHRSNGSEVEAAADASPDASSIAEDQAWRRDAGRRKGMIVRWLVVILFLGPSVFMLGSCVIGLFARPQ